MPATSLLLLAGLLAVLPAMVLAMIGIARRSPRARFRRRLRALDERLAARGAPEGTDGATRRRLIQGKLREMENQRNRGRRNTVRHLIAQSGLPIGLKQFVLGSIAAALIAALLTTLIGAALPVRLIAALGAGLAVPRAVLKAVIKRRQAAFTEHFADAIDILVRGARSGLPIGECLRIIGRELPDPVGSEFRLLTESQRIGMSLPQALERALLRMPTTELNYFSIVLVIQQQTGGNLASVLENLSTVLRARKRLVDKVQALSSEAKASAGIIGALPFLVGSGLWLMNPAYIGLLFTDTTGNAMLFGGLFWMFIGTLVMRQMIHFDS